MAYGNDGENCAAHISIADRCYEELKMSRHVSEKNIYFNYLDRRACLKVSKIKNGNIRVRLGPDYGIGTVSLRAMEIDIKKGEKGYKEFVCLYEKMGKEKS